MADTRKPQINFVDFSVAWQRHRGNVDAVAEELDRTPASVRKRAKDLIEEGAPLVPPQNKPRRVKLTSEQKIAMVAERLKAENLETESLEKEEVTA